MHNTAIICQEAPVPSASGKEITNEHCSKVNSPPVALRWLKYGQARR